MIQAVILAAGRSTRMGEQKLLMPFQGMPIIDFVIKTVLTCSFDRTFVVVSSETLDRLTHIEGAEYIVNPDPDRGQSSSFHCALSALSEGSSFAVFLADKPTVTAAQVMELRRRFEFSDPTKAGKNALVPQKDGVPGHPAFFSNLWRERFMSSGDSSRTILFRHADEVEWTEAHENFFMDVDTPEDYRRMYDNTI